MGTKYVRLDTNMGPFSIELYYEHAPKACHNFATLASQGYYNNTVFHRLIKDFIIQGNVFGIVRM